MPRSSPGRAGALLTLVLAGMSMLGPFSIDTPFPAFAQMRGDFGVGAEQMQLVVSAYMLAFAVMTPFHGPNIVAKIILLPFNFVFQFIELASKPLSLALRLFGNMYAGEIIFVLISLFAAAGFGGVFFGGLLYAGWAIFHILVVPLQAFIFMMLAAVYIAMAHEAH